MSCKWVIFLCCCSLLWYETFSFTSMPSLLRLLYTERDGIEKLNTFHGYIPPDLKNDFDVLRAINTSIYEQEVRYLENPLNTYHLLSRYSTTWKSIYSYCERQDNKCKDNIDLKELVSKLSKKWIEEDNISKARKEKARSLILLCTMYSLNISQVLDGVILDSVANPLTTDDIFYILGELRDRKLLHEERILLQGLIFKFQHTYNANVKHFILERIVSIVLHLVDIYTELKETSVALEVLHNALVLDDARLYASHKSTKLIHDTMQKGVKPSAFKSMEPSFIQHCSQDMKSTKELSVLYCQHTKTAIPYYRVKEEIVHISPRLSIFHDIITDQESKLLINLSSYQMGRSRVSDKNEASVDNNEIRISETSWIDNMYEKSPELDQVSWRISLVTGLNARFNDSMSGAENFQVVNYGTGGFFFFHHDAFQTPLWERTKVTGPLEPRTVQGTGDRIATWMFYLSDVKAGGATVFPRINAKVYPKKGSAVFWYNYRPDGSLNDKMLHGGCPVLLGSKWVTNRWIRQSSQVLNSLCDKDKENLMFITRK